MRKRAPPVGRGLVIAGCPCSDGAAPGATATHDHAAKQHEHDCADDRGDDGADVEDTIHRVVPGNQTDDVAGKQRAHETEHDVADDAESLVTLDEQAGKPAGDRSYDEP